MVGTAAYSIACGSSCDAQPPPAQKSDSFSRPMSSARLSKYLSTKSCNFKHIRHPAHRSAECLPASQATWRVSQKSIGPIGLYLNDASFAGILLHENATVYTPHKSVVRLQVWSWQMPFSGILPHRLPNLLLAGFLTAYVVFLEQKMLLLGCQQVRGAIGQSNLQGKRFAIAT